MELDLDTLGYVSGELSGFFAHLAKAFAQKKGTGTLPPSLFTSTADALVPMPVTNGRKSKKVKKYRAPRCVAAPPPLCMS